MTKDLRHPSPRLRAAAEVVYETAKALEWSGFVAPTYREFERTNPIGFEEFNAIIDLALEAADKAT